MRLPRRSHPSRGSPSAADGSTRPSNGDAALGRTPLTIVVLALIAVRSDDPGDLPRSRAKLLHRALMDVVDRWEVEARRRGVVEAGGLSLVDAREAITVTPRVLSSAAVSGAGVDAAEVRARVASALLEEFGQAPGAARGAAQESIAFWTEVALFSLDGGALVARIRQFAELGHAWGPALDGAPEPSRWIADARRSSDLWASLALGAGLSATIAQQWADALAADGGADELIAFVEAVCDGVHVTQETLSVVARDAAARHLAHEGDAERVAEVLLLLPLAPEMRRELRPALTAAVPTLRKAVVDALTIVRWNESGPDVDERLRRLVTAPAPPPPADLRRPEDSELFWPPEQDETYALALEGAMLRAVVSHVPVWLRALPAFTVLLLLSAGAVSVGLLVVVGRQLACRRALRERASFTLVPTDRFAPDVETVLRFASGLSRARRTIGARLFAPGQRRARPPRLRRRRPRPVHGHRAGARGRRAADRRRRVRPGRRADRGRRRRRRGSGRTGPRVRACGAGARTVECGAAAHGRCRPRSADGLRARPRRGGDDRRPRRRRPRPAAAGPRAGATRATASRPGHVAGVARGHPDRARDRRWSAASTRSRRAGRAGRDRRSTSRADEQARQARAAVRDPDPGARRVADPGRGGRPPTRPPGGV